MYATMTGPSAGVDGIGGQWGWWLARVDTCALVPVEAPGGEFSPGLCARIDTGLIESTGESLTNSNPARRWWFAPGLAIRAAWQTRHGVLVAMGGGLTLPLTNYTYFYVLAPEDSAPHSVHTIPAYAVTASVGVAYGW
jgi:hypothetical protein